MLIKWEYQLPTVSRNPYYGVADEEDRSHFVVRMTVPHRSSGSQRAVENH
jgi:hypothetical protein